MVGLARCMQFFRYLAVCCTLVLLYSCGGGTSTSSPKSPQANTAFQNLSTVSSTEIGRDFLHAEVHGDAIYYTDVSLGLSSLNTADPERLVAKTKLIDSFHSMVNLNGYDYLYGFKMAGNVAVVQVNEACLGMCMGDRRDVWLYDMVPDRPKLLSKLGIAADDVFAEGSLLYVIGSSGGTSTTKLFIMDISDPTNPVTKSSSPVSAAGYLAKKGGILYLSRVRYDTGVTGVDDIQTVDVSDPAHPVTNSVPSTSFNIRYAQISVAGNALFIFDSHGLNIFDITGGNPQFIKTVSIPEPKSFAVNNSHLFVAAGELGVQIYDITRPQDPIYLKSLKSRTDALSVSVANGVGCFISDTIRRYDSVGYSTLSGYWVNLFYDK